jgi:hypothetical protein
MVFIMLPVLPYGRGTHKQKAADFMVKSMTVRKAGMVSWTDDFLGSTLWVDGGIAQ